MEAFADNKMNAAKMIISLFCMLENIVGKGENALNVFKRLLSYDCYKSGLCGKGLNLSQITNIFSSKLEAFADKTLQ